MWSLLCNKKVRDQKQIWFWFFFMTLRCPPLLSLARPLFGIVAFHFHIWHYHRSRVRLGSAQEGTENFIAERKRTRILPQKHSIHAVDVWLELIELISIFSSTRLSWWRCTGVWKGEQENGKCFFFFSRVSFTCYETWIMIRTSMEDHD